jgi:hypothetical protein
VTELDFGFRLLALYFWPWRSSLCEHEPNADVVGLTLATDATLTSSGSRIVLIISAGPLELSSPC